jgi:cytochrome c-type biogenesis protein
VAGFAVVFVLLGSLTGAAGAWLFVHYGQLNIALGLIMILLGIAFLGGFGLLQRDWRIHRVPAVGLAAAPVIGFLFGVGWTPCVGPTLGAINALALNEATAGRGAVLSGVFALGLGLPFIAAAFAYRRMIGAFAVIRRHQVLIMRFGGLMMIAVGLLLVSGWWERLVQSLQSVVLGFWTPL